MRLIPLLLLPAVAACVNFAALDRKIPRADGDRAVLFIGNSHTYVYDVPAIVEWMARQMGDSVLQTEQVSAANYALEDHLAMGWAQDALAQSRWRWVVLQQGTSALAANQLNLEQYTRVFDPLIRQAGAEPVLYQIWPHAARRFDADAALTSYWNAAVAVNGILAPAGDAFTAALEQLPPLAVYDGDGLHASRYGAYLSAAVIYARIAGTSPELLPPRIPGSSTDSVTVRALQRAAVTALGRSPERPTVRRIDKPSDVAVDTGAFSLPRVLSADSTFFPEGIDIDARNGALYVTSIHHRNVYRVAGEGRLAPVIAESAAPIGAAMGVRVDAARELLWVTTANLPYMRDHGVSPAQPELLAISLADGSIRQRYTLGDGSGAPGDLALGSDGSLFVSDALRGTLYRLRPGADALEVLRSDALRSPQGIAVHPAGGVAWVADWTRGLQRWDLATDRIEPVTTEDGKRLGGVDGLVLLPDGSLIGVQNGATRPRVLRITLSDDGRRISALDVLDASEYEGEPTGGVVVGDRFTFVSSSAWPFWDDAGKRRATPRGLPAVTLRTLPIDR